MTRSRRDAATVAADMAEAAANVTHEFDCYLVDAGRGAAP